MLPECGHTFCRECLLNLQSTSLVCPNCRQHHYSVCVEELPVNFAQLGIATALSNIQKSKDQGQCSKHSLPLDLWCSVSQREMCAMCYFEETKQTQQRVLTLAERRQFTVDAIRQKSLILSQLYTTLKHCLTSDSESMCQNSYAKKLNDILRGEELGILPSSTIDKRLDGLKKMMFPPDREKRSGTGSSRESRQEAERPDKMKLRCVAKCDKGKKARLTWEEDQLHIYALCVDPEEAHITLNMRDVRLLVSQENPTVFVDVADRDGPIGRVNIKVWTHLRRGQQFLALCQGHLGPTLKGSAFLDVTETAGIDCLRGGRYLTENGTSSHALMDRLEWNEGHERPGRKGLVAGWSFRKAEDETLFGIALGECHIKFCCPFGEVVSGMSIVEDIAYNRTVRDVTIVEVGTAVRDFATN
uniref:TRIM-like protein n=1 Tax=Penaeus monodon TaxID=6687 RepID=A0A8F4QBM1_PENMO|nr:TRIM-like protein [Penaeus monodon]